MDRRNLILGGAVLGAGLVAEDLLAPAPAEAAALRVQQGEVNLPGLGPVQLVLVIQGRVVTGTLGGGVLNALVEGTFVRNVVAAQVFDATNLGAAVGTLEARTGRRNTLTGTLRLEDQNFPVVTQQLAVSTNLRSLAGTYEGDIRLAASGKPLADHTTTVARTGIATMEFRVRDLAATGRPGALGTAPGVDTNLIGYTTRVARTLRVHAGPSGQTLTDLKDAPEDAAAVIAAFLVQFARGGATVPGSEPNDCSFQGIGPDLFALLMSFQR